MKDLLLVFMLFLFVGCSSKVSLNGEYKAVGEDSIIESISFDGTVISFGGRIGKFMPSSRYEIKNNRVYVDTAEGVLVFEILNSDTIECQTSIFKGDRFVK